MSSSDNRKIILDVLREHPEGLTIVSLAEISGLHRHTATKYIYELLGAGAVLQRTVGVAKLCYMCDTIKDQNDEKKLVEGLEIRRNSNFSQIKTVAIVAFIAFLLSGTAILAYQNTSILNETNSSDALDINTSPLTSVTDANASSVMDNLINSSSVENAVLNTSDNSTQETSTGTNLTVEQSNGTLEGINGTIQASENMTTVLENVSETVNETPQDVLKNMVLRLDYPEKVVRGGIVAVKAFILNADSIKAENVFITWSIPDGFTLISGSQKEFFGAVNPNETYTSEITLKTDTSTVAGISKIKAVVNYE
jgi:hypothetical protein